MNKRIKKFIESILLRKMKNIVRDIFREKELEDKSPRQPNSPSGQGDSDLRKTHPWRICPVGQHWKRDHPMKVPVSGKNPDGYTIRDGHCHTNPGKKKGKVILDYLDSDEIHLMTELYGPIAIPRPVTGKLKEYKDADLYDNAIAVWTQYWNENFKPEVLLDPDLVKALIVTESGFRSNPKEQIAGSAGLARGLIQITDQAIMVMNDPDGDFKNHHIRITEENVKDPIVSIAAGTRWLFEKRRLAKHRLKRDPTWEESIAEYKAYLPDMILGKNPYPKGMVNLKKYYERLKE